jgi:ribosomal protein L11 methyltransferase
MPSPITRKKRNDAALMDIQQIQNAILEKVSASPTRLTPQNIEKTISETCGLNKTDAKSVLKELVARGELEYTYEFGSTYLVRSFNKPVRIADHVVLVPMGQSLRPATDEMVIQIKPGAAFGGGRHPTTRLSISAIEYILKRLRPNFLNRDCSVLDIGTGSGILAIAAVCLGIKKGLGIDIDPCAIAEARENIILNNLQNRIVISDRKIDSIDQAFTMVVANLRYPSLKKLYPRMLELTGSGGWVVLSGFRPYEQADLLGRYTAGYFKCIWTADENDWAAAILKKN